MQSRGCDHTKVRGHQATLWHVNYGASSSGIPCFTENVYLLCPVGCA